MDYKQMNGLSLAYVGDAVYEVAVRKYLIDQGLTKVQKLHSQATYYVSAKAQAKLIRKLLEDDLLTEEEIAIYHRGRNAKSHTSAKNTDIKTYRMSTGFESVIGYLSLEQKEERLTEIINWCLKNGGKDQK